MAPITATSTRCASAPLSRTTCATASPPGTHMDWAAPSCPHNHDENGTTPNMARNQPGAARNCPTPSSPPTGRAPTYTPAWAPRPTDPSARRRLTEHPAGRRPERLGVQPDADGPEQIGPAAGTWPAWMASL